jgi:apolipoprotein D and lipocalin family protein
VRKRGKATKRGLLSVLATSLLAGCLGMPEGVEPVSGFELERYAGKWYEVARLDHSFERGMEQVSAEYSVDKDGTVAVVNKGYRPDTNKWKQATGKAKFVGEADVGYLKVSFFGPFYGSYVVFDLDKQNYNYAFVSGPDVSFLWLMSRTKTAEPQVMDSFLQQAKAAGFNTDELIRVKHD